MGKTYSIRNKSNLKCKLNGNLHSLKHEKHCELHLHTTYQILIDSLCHKKIKIPVMLHSTISTFYQVNVFLMKTLSNLNLMRVNERSNLL